MSPRGKNVLAQLFQLWLGRKFPFLVQKTKVVGAERGWTVGLVGAGHLLALAVFGMTASKAVSLHFHGTFIHPAPAFKASSLTRLWAICLTLKTSWVFLPSIYPCIFFMDIGHLQRALLLFADKVTIPAHLFCSLEKHTYCVVRPGIMSLVCSTSCVTLEKMFNLSELPPYRL